MSLFTLREQTAAKSAFCSTRLPHTTVHLTEASLVSLREISTTLTYSPMTLVHRGRYAFSDAPIATDLQDAIARCAELVVGGTLQWVRHRFSRLRRGDYALYKDDESWLDVRTATSTRVDFTIDLSQGTTGEAEVLYTHRGDVFCVLEQRPGAGCLVQREPTVRRYERYLSHRVENAEVSRLRICFERGDKPSAA